MKNYLSIDEVVTEEDVRDFAHLLYLDTVEGFSRFGAVATKDRAIEDASRYTDSNETEVKLARVNGKPAGYTVWSFDGDTINSEWLYVRPTFRGEGIARELKEEQIKYGKENGYSRLNTFVAWYNDVSLRLFRDKMGLVPEERRGGYNFSINL